jgi:hypothetical protein
MKAAGRGLGVSPFSVRAFIVVVGLGATAWGSASFPRLMEQLAPHRVAVEILDGQQLLDEIALVDSAERSRFCDAAELHDALLLHLGILKDAVAPTNRVLVSTSLTPVRDAATRALSCGPTDAFGWLMLFWLDAVKRGITPENCAYLRLSYALGPNEAWIALWRNRLALARFGQLPPDLAKLAVDEFIGLVNTGTAYSETAAIFVGAPPAVQTLVLAHLAKAKPRAREIFARTLRDNGFEVDVPGVERPARPWQP